MKVCLLRFNVLRHSFLRSFNFDSCSKREIRRSLSYCGQSSFSSIHNAANAKRFGGSTVRLCFPACNAQFQVISVRRFHKLHVKNLPENTTEAMLYDHFSQFGSITCVKMGRTGDICKPPDSACVFFFDKKGFDKAMSVQSHRINDQPVSICQLKDVCFLVPALSKLTTRDSLHAYFSRYGNVFRCALKHGDLNEITGFVNYAEPNEAHIMLTCQKHVIDGKLVEVKYLFSKELTRYVGNLSPSTTDESLAAYFSQFKTLTQACVMKDPKSGESRGFGYISYTSEEEVNSVISSSPHILDGQELKFGGNRRYEIFVSRLPENTTEQSLREYFEQFGPVFECRGCTKQADK